MLMNKKEERSERMRVREELEEGKSERKKVVVRKLTEC